MASAKSYLMKAITDQKESYIADVEKDLAVFPLCGGVQAFVRLKKRAQHKKIRTDLETGGVQPEVKHLKLGSVKFARLAGRDFN